MALSIAAGESEKAAMLDSTEEMDESKLDTEDVLKLESGVLGSASEGWSSLVSESSIASAIILLSLVG